MRKRILLALAALTCYSTLCFSQIHKGSLFLGGDLSGTTQQTKSEGNSSNKFNSVYLSPVAGTVVKENLVVGLLAGFGFYENYDNGNFDNQQQHAYSLGVFVRKYYFLGKSGFSVFVNGKLSEEYSDIRLYSSPGYSNIAKKFSTGIAVYPGISYGLSKRLQLETGFNSLLYLNFFTEKRDINQGVAVSYKTNGLSIGSSLNNLSSLYIGFRLLINK
jgi:hypothetical protein